MCDIKTGLFSDFVGSRAFVNFMINDIIPTKERIKYQQKKFFRQKRLKSANSM